MKHLLLFVGMFGAYNLFGMELATHQPPYWVAEPTEKLRDSVVEVSNTLKKIHREIVRIRSMLNLEEANEKLSLFSQIDASELETFLIGKELILSKSTEESWLRDYAKNQYFMTNKLSSALKEEALAYKELYDIPNALENSQRYPRKVWRNFNSSNKKHRKS